MADAAALRGRVALVTGGSRGVGEGIAVVLGEAGATAYVTGRRVIFKAEVVRYPGRDIRDNPRFVVTNL